MATDRQQFTLFSFQQQNPKNNLSEEQKTEADQEAIQNQTIFMKWNSKPNPNYKLQFYNYFSEFVGTNFEVKSYNKFGLNHFPKLQYYLRYSKSLFPEQIEQTKNSFYNAFMSDPMESEVITKPYTGRYSQQPDYHFFRRM